MTTLDGNPIFGDAVCVQHLPHPNTQQINEFFGINGQQTLFGGTRGRTFAISGVLSAGPPDVECGRGDPFILRGWLTTHSGRQSRPDLVQRDFQRRLCAVRTGTVSGRQWWLVFAVPARDDRPDLTCQLSVVSFSCQLSVKTR